MFEFIFLMCVPLVRRAFNSLLFDPKAEIARFKSDFDAMGKILITTATLTLMEGLSEIKTNLYNLEENVKNVEHKSEVYSLSHLNTSLICDIRVS